VILGITFNAGDAEALFRSRRRFKALTSEAYGGCSRCPTAIVLWTRSFDPGFARRNAVYPRLLAADLAVMLAPQNSWLPRLALGEFVKRVRAQGQALAVAPNVDLRSGRHRGPRHNASERWLSPQGQKTRGSSMLKA